ncbi:MAG: cadherin-like domain-containing protein, partial [Saprospiraceae bacterium]|nr:cadherin-like domain-containing protein [Saprospiraceae bacterium]
MVKVTPPLHFKRLKLNLMKGLFTRLLIASLLFVGFYTDAQQSTNTVGYKITYSQTTSTYTVWVVPDYSLPSSNNPEVTEKGATAQVTVAVPKDFVITNITDVRGSWEKSPLKLGPGQPGQDWSSTSLDTETNYYVIGKSAEETNYGSFNTGVDVALFTFQGNSCLGVVRIIEPNEPFIVAADNLFSLNTANSFYSRSGQPAGGNQNPLEQFRTVVGSPANCSLDLSAVADNATTSPSVPINISVLTNDTKNGVPITINDVSLVVSQNASNGNSSINADGTIRYVPNPGFSGVDCFQYRICEKDNPSVCRTAQVCVTVTGSSFVALPDNPTTNAGAATTTNVLGNDTKNGSPVVPSEVTVSIQTQPSNGTVLVNPDGTIKYTPNAGFAGQDCYTYKVCDKVLNTSCGTAQVCVTVTGASFVALPDAPTTNAGVATTTNVLG